jgi:thiol-disulfide isomerase/thioredoxin
MLRLTNISLFLVIIILTNSCCDCKKTKTEEKQLITPIVGQMSWDTWKEKAEWKDYNADSYIINKDRIKIIENLIKRNNINFILVAGNWCSDSEREIPKFFKLIQEANINMDKIILYGVDREKKEPTGETIQYNIEKVPTLIILKNSEEIGRIVEFPVISWDEDLLTILEGIK